MIQATNNNEPHVAIFGDSLHVRFDRFDIDAYRLFLRVKALPEFTLNFNETDESYSISAPSRFAHMLGVQADAIQRGDLPLAEFLFDDQSAIVRMALDAKRFAIWSDCGLGKTPMTLEWARQVIHSTGGKVLIFTLNEIVDQFVEECQKFYGDSLPIVKLGSRKEMKAWAASGGSGLAITNYEKMNYVGDDQVVNELRHLAGVALDESSRLKGGGGKQKWALIKSCKGIEYKLSCTATPAPNDVIEFASQASFLEKMKTDADIIWTYFHRDPKTLKWNVKRHARKAFFEFMSSWSIYVRSPKRYGWRLDQPDLPEPIIFQHTVPMTEEQRTALQKHSVEPSGQMSLLNVQSTDLTKRSKLSQIAKGFVYVKSKSGRKVERIASLKPRFIAKLIQQEVESGLQVLVWTVFDAESDLIAEELTKLEVMHQLLTGKVKEADRVKTLEEYRTGQIPVLVSRASMLGYGMNFQNCGSMIFSGWSDSYESYYQAIRRAYRFGQTRNLRVHIPVIEELEGDMLENIFHKQAMHEAAIAEMEQNYIEATKRVVGTV